MEKIGWEHYIQPEIYDLAYSWQTEDIPFYVARAQEARGPVLEAGCGTGRVLIPTLQEGVDIDGFDIQPAMIEHLRRKAAALNLQPRLYQADMRDFTMPRRYALITIPFRAFMHLLETDDQIRALRCMREHLESGGALIFNLFYPNLDHLVTKVDGEVHPERDFPHPETGLPISTSFTRQTDRVRQVMNVEVEILESDARGYAAATHRHRFSLRWTFKPEMELLLRAAGFSRWQVHGGFDGRPLERDTDEMVWTAWKD